MASITAPTPFLTAAKSRSGATLETPAMSIASKRCAAFPAASNAFDGTQPEFKHSPPISARSIKTVLSPSRDVPAATDRPAEPAPITQTSNSDYAKRQISNFAVEVELLLTHCR